MDLAAPQAARGSDPVEDQRRDEVLCRLLNTPYRPIDRLRTKESPRMPVAEISEKV
jgi:hypothetical protein